MKLSMINVRRMGLLLCLLATLLTESCIAPITAPTQPAKTTQPVKLKVQLLPLLSFAPYFIAQEEGYFAQQGLEVEFVRVERSSDVIPALLQGDLDVMAGAISFGLLNAMGRDSNIKLVADKGYLAVDDCTDVAIVARKDLLVNKTVDDLLKGAKVAVNPLSIRGYILAQALETSGLTMDNVETVDLANPLLSEAFASSSIDFAVTTEPWTTRMLQSGNADIWVAAQQMLPNLQIGLITYGPNLLNKSPDVGERFMVAYLQGVRQYNEGKTERNLKIMAQYTELSIDDLQAACWGSMRDDGEIDMQSILDFQDWGVAQAAVDQSLTGDALFDRQFIDAANSVLGASASK